MIEGELEPAELEKINIAREDARMVKLREAVFGVVRNVVEIWSADAGVGHVCSFNCFPFLVRELVPNMMYTGVKRSLQINNLLAD